jgi:two-component system, NtrC family, response regulator
MKAKVLVVDDDEEIRTQMKWALAAEHEVSLAADATEAVAVFREQRPAMVLLDLGLPPNPNDPSEGMTALARLLSMDRAVKVIILSGQSDRANAVAAIGAGAYDFLPKPVDVAQLRMLIQRAMYISALESDYRRMQEHERADVFEGILGASGPMQEVFRTIGKVASSSAPVLILGESGTGKEMVANAIHRRSLRGERPFVALNCNAIPENLIESELFGHEKGAFTGATGQRAGLIETAAGGTLFLDEIGDLAPAIQVKLLRYLQEKRIQRVGGRREIEVDTRVLAATHVDLPAAIASGRFREDLYFRLAVVVCKLPALRERGDDVVVLAQDFLKSFSRQNGRTGLSYEPHALAVLRAHDWPGNVRELQNRVHRAVIMADGPRITAADLELGDGQEPAVTEELVTAAAPNGMARSGVIGLREAREQVEREMIGSALTRHDRNISAAAKELGISRPPLYELMSKLGISKS